MSPTARIGLAFHLAKTAHLLPGPNTSSRDALRAIADHLAGEEPQPQEALLVATRCLARVAPTSAAEPAEILLLSWVANLLSAGPDVDCSPPLPGRRDATSDRGVGLPAYAAGVLAVATTLQRLIGQAISEPQATGQHEVLARARLLAGALGADASFVGLPCADTPTRFVGGGVELADRFTEWMKGRALQVAEDALQDKASAAFSLALYEQQSATWLALLDEVEQCETQTKADVLKLSRIQIRGLMTLAKGLCNGQGAAR